MADEIGTLVEAIDGLVAREPHALSDRDSIRELYRQQERLNAAVARATAAFDAKRDWEADGARTAAAWLRTRCRVPRSTAARRVHFGRALRDMPIVERTWLAGDLTEAHVGLLADARTVNSEAFARDEELLCRQAIETPFTVWRRALAYWRQLADPDGDERNHKEMAGRRHLNLSRTFEDAWRLDGWLDPLNGTIVSNELRRIEQRLFEEDWHEARQHKGDAATVADLPRTAAQRRADALVEMATRSRAMPAGSRRPEPLFTVLVGYETFAGRMCELANGTVVSPGALVPYLNEAWIERIVFGSPSRVLDVGVQRRLFRGATRRAIEVRDRECTHEMCDTEAEYCEGDHDPVPFADGGLTTQDNGRLACGFHNRHKRTG